MFAKIAMPTMMVCYVYTNPESYHQLRAVVVSQLLFARPFRWRLNFMHHGHGYSMCVLLLTDCVCLCAIGMQEMVYSSRVVDGEWLFVFYSLGTTQRASALLSLETQWLENIWNSICRLNICVCMVICCTGCWSVGLHPHNNTNPRVCECVLIGVRKMGISGFGAGLMHAWWRLVNVCRHELW